MTKGRAGPRPQGSGLFKIRPCHTLWLSYKKESPQGIWLFVSHCQKDGFTAICKIYRCKYVSPIYVQLQLGQPSPHVLARMNLQFGWICIGSGKDFEAQVEFMLGFGSDFRHLNWA